MRIQTKSIFATLVIISLVFGAVGCKSNGGDWYKPNSYTFYNPFKGEDIDSQDAAQASTKPSMDSYPDVNVPPGGYSSKEDEEKYYAGKTEGSKSVVSQYGASNLGTTNNKVASTQNSANLSTGNYSPIEAPYSPYGPADASAPGSTVTNNYPPNSYYGTGTVPSAQPPVYPGTGIQGVNPAPYQPQSTAVPSSYPSQTVQPSSGLSYEQTPVNTPVYGQPASTNNYGVPTATPNNLNPAPTGFNGIPNNSNPVPTGFTGTPSSIYSTANPSGF